MPDQPTHELPQVVGRGAQIKPANRFLTVEVEDDFEHFEHDEEFLAELRRLKTEYYADDSQSILSENKSPDIPFRYSLNPYRGCAHGCSYCYARPTHEYFGLNAGLDFESKIFVKEKAPELLRRKLESRSWECEPIMFSGVTDCYQPAERSFRLTRACLEVAGEFNQPVSIITKNALVTRDIDLLADLARRNLTRVAISMTSMDQELTRGMEPRTSSPAARLRAMRELSAAGIQVTVMTAPVIPGLNDSEIPKLLELAKQNGASYAGYVMLRLPQTVEPVFLDWLARHVPSQQAKVESLVKQVRDGGLNQSEFRVRMRGTGTMADHLSDTFKLFVRKHGLSQKPPPLDRQSFAVPAKSGQLRLFDS